MPPADAPRRPPAWLPPLCAAAVGMAVLFPGSIAFSNIDDYQARAFGVDFGGKLQASLAADLGDGRFRPGYWLLQGAIGAATRDSARGLVVARLLFLGASIALLAWLARRLGAAPWLGALLGLALGWSLPALAIWVPAGPAEAFALPLALLSAALALEAAGPRGFAAAVGAGLLAALCKENFGALSSAALGAVALAALLRGERGAGTWVAVGGALLPLAPAIVAAVGVGPWSRSYLGYVVTVIRSPASEVALMAARLELAAVALGAAGLAAVLIRLVRTPWRAWPAEDLVPLAVLADAAAEAVALGYTVPRYQVGLVAALLLVAARGAATLGRLPRPRLAGGAALLLLALAVAPGAVRAWVYSESAAADRRLDERMRQELAAALLTSGGARVFWLPDMVEHPIGALAHLRIDGVEGPVELRPCTPISPASAGLLGGLFAANSRPVGGPVPLFVSTWCPGVPATTQEQHCDVVLPGVAALASALLCFPLPERMHQVVRP